MPFIYEHIPGCRNSYTIIIDESEKKSFYWICLFLKKKAWKISQMKRAKDGHLKYNNIAILNFLNFINILKIF